MNGELFTDIMLAVITILGAIVTYVLVPFLKQKNVYNWIKMAVQGAEQVFQGSNLGEKKKAYVLGKLQKWGIKVNEKQLDTLIESAVLELNNSIK